MKTKQTFKLDQEIIDALKALAVKDSRSFNNYVETVLRDHTKKTAKK